MNIIPSHNVPADTIAALITAYQAESGATDEQVAIRLGYDKGNIVTLIKRDAMSLPQGKVESLAEVTGVDTGRVLELWLRERNPELLKLLQSIWASSTLTPSERRLVDHCRPHPCR